MMERRKVLLAALAAPFAAMLGKFRASGAISGWRAYYKNDHNLFATADEKCPKCGQTDRGQAGEYPCSVCGLPLLWDRGRTLAQAISQEECWQVERPTAQLPDGTWTNYYQWCSFATRKEAVDFTTSLRLLGNGSAGTDQPDSSTYWELISMNRGSIDRLDHGRRFFDSEAGFHYIDAIRIRKAGTFKPRWKNLMTDQVGCGKAAEWELVHGPRPDDYTHACSEHLGGLLTDAKEHRVYPAPKGAKCCFMYSGV